MAISEEAQRIHDALFPNHKSTLKVTDPELIEIFDNWAFGEVPKDGSLDTRTRLTVCERNNSGAEGYRFEPYSGVPYKSTTYRNGFERREFGVRLGCRSVWPSLDGPPAIRRLKARSRKV